jgi:hypothetical protein
MAGVDKFKGVRLVRLVQCLVGGTEGRLSKCSLGLTHDQRVMRHSISPQLINLLEATKSRRLYGMVCC